LEHVCANFRLSSQSLLFIDSGFVVKMMHLKMRALSNDMDKLFLNIVYSEKLAEPNAIKSEHGGSTWSIPYALGPLRLEQDKSGTNLVATFDCCFNPLSLRYAHARKEFLNLAINIATDAVVNSFKMSGDEVKIIGGFTILRGVSYKSGTPKALLVSINTNSGETKPKENNKPIEVVPSVDPVVTAVESSAVETSSMNGDTATILVPKYKIVEQGLFDIADHTENCLIPNVVPRRPKHLIVHIYLEKSTSSAADINLDVSEKELKIQPDSRCRYDLAVKLPHPVNSQKGHALFDKKQSSLIVKLPVVA
jgi:dynein assembly factor 2